MMRGLLKIELGRFDSRAQWRIAHIGEANERGPEVTFSSTIKRFEVRTLKDWHYSLFLLTIRFEQDCLPRASACVLSAFSSYLRHHSLLHDEPTYNRTERVFTCTLKHRDRRMHSPPNALIVGSRLWHITLIHDALCPMLAKRGAAWELFDLPPETPPAAHHELRASHT